MAYEIRIRSVAYYTCLCAACHLAEAAGWLSQIWNEQLMPRRRVHPGRNAKRNRERWARRWARWQRRRPRISRAERGRRRARTLQQMMSTPSQSQASGAGESAKMGLWRLGSNVRESWVRTCPIRSLEAREHVKRDRVFVFCSIAHCYCSSPSLLKTEYHPVL